MGDDANPCSRTAPCKTFAGAISKTAPGGEINCIDPGGFGGVTITKSLTIKCQYTEGGVLVSGTNAIVVNAAATDKVTLKGLDINGFKGGTAPSLVGVKVLSAGKVTLIDDEIYSFQAGVDVVPTSANTRVLVSRSHIHDNGIGVITAPGANGITSVQSTLRYNDIHDNTCNVVGGAFGTNASTPAAATNCGTAALAVINQPVRVRLVHTGVEDGTTGVFSRGSNSIADLAYNDVIGNATGLQTLDSGVINSTSPATNVMLNATGNTPTGTTPLAKRSVKRYGVHHRKLRKRHLR